MSLALSPHRSIAEWKCFCPPEKPRKGDLTPYHAQLLAVERARNSPKSS